VATREAQQLRLGEFRLERVRSAEAGHIGGAGKIDCVGEIGGGVSFGHSAVERVESHGPAA